MWENPKDKNDEKYGSLRNILKNFDAYAVLEPLTPQGIPKENILVDLSVKSANNDSNLELSGSLLDKSTKSDFEVIDVFQNLYVTPQHVTNKNINDNKDWIKAFDIEHKNIEIDIKKELENIFTVEKTNLNATLTRLSDDEFDVDEIDEVLRIKRIKKLIKTQQNASSSNFESQSNNTGTTQNTDIKTNNLQDNIIAKIDKQENIRTINNIVKKKLNNFDIKTVKLDKKKLQKKIVLPDDVKRNYTKGPDLLEKSIALPSMIERIKERQQMINNEKCLRHRLVLEPDNLIISNDKKLYKFNPEALTEDCNKERLTALHGGRAFERFVTGEK